MATETEYQDDVRLLDDLTRLKLRLIDRKLQQPSARYTRRERRRSPSPVAIVYTPEPPPPPERRRSKFHKKLDRRNEVLQKLWEELGNGGHRTYARSLPPLSPRPVSRAELAPLAPWIDDNFWNKKGNTKKDLMELMLIQNAQMQQWLMTQTLQRNQMKDDGNVHHYYYANGQGPPVRVLPPIRKNDAGNQYPQDFMREDGVDFNQDVQRQPHTQLVYAADAQVTNSGTGTNTAAGASPTKSKRGKR